MPLGTTDLYLLSAVMQALAALWGIVFVVYLFIYGYYSRGGGWQDAAQKRVDQIKRDVEQAPREVAAYPSGRTYPSVTRRLRDGLDSIPYTRKAARRYRRVFRQVLFTGPIVLASVLADVLVLALNDTSLVGVTIVLFVAALLALAYVLLAEVWTSISGASSLLSKLDQAEKEGRDAYEEARKTILEQ